MSEYEENPKELEAEIEIEIIQADVENEEYKKEPPIEFYEGTTEYNIFDADIDYSD